MNDSADPQAQKTEKTSPSSEAILPLLEQVARRDGIIAREMEDNQRLKRELGVRSLQLTALQEKDAALEQTIHEITSSRSWRFLSMLRKISARLLPPGSFQHRLARRVLNGLKNAGR